MVEIKCVLGVLFCLILQTGKVQSVPNDMLLNVTFCDVISNMNISCANDEKIAIDSMDFYYHPECNSQCCSYNKSHSTVGADENDIQTLRRACSGTKDCSVDISGQRNFSSAGAQTPSYTVVKYYCIPDNRTTSICDNKELESNGLPLYLTNKNYPSVTTTMSTCSCSVQVNSCSSDITLSVLDLDLYHKQDKCEQNIDLTNGTDDLLEKLHCGDYYNNSITVKQLRSHYLKINFINNSTQNLEGFFFIGFAASQEKVSFNLSCPFKQEVVCIPCDNNITIPNGDVVPHDVNDTREGALANITCDTGYMPDRHTVKCLNTGNWEKASCTPIDCGKVPVLQFGKYKLMDENNTAFGANATVTCEEGYDSGTDMITCLDNGEWSSALCKAKDCGTVKQIENGKVSLKTGITTFGAIADIVCNNGYSASSSSITCLSTGKWEAATCTIKDCGSVNQIDNGKVLLKTESTKFGAVANIKCDTGYSANPSSISCLSTGAWETAKCTIKDCGIPPKIKYGSAALKKDSKTTYESIAEIKCHEGYVPKKQMIKCEETGQWERSSCEHLSEKEGSKAGIIVAAVLIPIIVIGLLILGILCFIKYRRQGYLLRTISSKGGHDSVSFKNKEVLPDDDQNTNLFFSNETENQEEQQSVDSKETQDKEEDEKEIKKDEESSTPVKEADQDLNLNNGVKSEEAENCTRSNESNENKDENVTDHDTSAACKVHNNGDPKEGTEVQEASKMGETSKTDQNEDVKGQESNNDEIQNVNKHTPDETSQFDTDNPKEGIIDQKATETNETDKLGQNNDENIQETNEHSEDAAKHDIKSQTSGEATKDGMDDSKEDAKDQEPSNTNEVNKGEVSKDDEG